MNTFPSSPHDETAASLSGRDKTDALRALQVLSEAATPPPAEESELPPLPPHLRERWQDTYGDKATAPAPASVREGWLQRVARFFATPRAAWTGGLAAAAAAIVLLMANQHSATTGVTADGGGDIITRGGAHGPQTAGAAARLLVVAPADKAGPLLAELAKAFPARQIDRVDSAPAGGTGDAIVIDTVARSVSRAGQNLSAQIPGDPLVEAGTVIMAIESLDEPEAR